MKLWNGLVWTIIIQSVFTVVFLGGPVVSAKPINDDEILFEQGLDLCDQARYREALIQFQKLIEIFPASQWSDDACYLMGECKLTMGDIHGAVEQFKQAVLAADSPELAADAQYMIALCNADLGMTKEAVAAYSDLIENYPRSVRVEAAQRYIAIHSVSPKDQESSGRKTISETVDVSVDSETAASQLTLLEIEKVLKKALPGSEDADLYNFGLSMHTTNHVAAAVVIYKRLLELFPDTLWKADVWYMLAESYVSMADLEKAISAYRETLKWSTSATLSADAQFMIAESLMGLKNFPEALENYRLLLSNFSESVWAVDSQFMIGEIHRVQGNYKEASETFRSLVERFPGSRWRGDIKAYLSSIGEEQVSAGTLPPTTAEARAVSLSSDLEEHRKLGLRYKSHGEYAKALGEFQRILELDPTDVEATVVCALLHHNLGHLSRAIALLEKAQALDPDNLEVISLYGYLCYLSGNYRKSIEAYKKVVTADPEGRFGREADRAIRKIKNKLE